MAMKLRSNGERYTSSLPHTKATPSEYLRIVDESGEDYLYPASWFEPVHLAPTLETRIVGSLSPT